jgi:hypothetical protein
MGGSEGGRNMFALGLLFLILGIGILAAKVVFSLVFLPLRIGFGLAKVLLAALIGIPLLILGFVFAAAIPLVIVGIVLALIVVPVVLAAKILF